MIYQVGTAAATHMALRSLDIGRYAEFPTSILTYVGGFSRILIQNTRLVIFDVLSDTWTINAGLAPEELLRTVQEDIEARPIWKPMHRQPVSGGYPFVGNGVAERLFEEGACLPSGTQMTDEDQFRVIEAIRGVWRG